MKVSLNIPPFFNALITGIVRVTAPKLAEPRINAELWSHVAPSIIALQKPFSLHEDVFTLVDDKIYPQDELFRSFKYLEEAVELYVRTVRNSDFKNHSSMSMLKISDDKTQINIEPESLKKVSVIDDSHYQGLIQVSHPTGEQFNIANFLFMPHQLILYSEGENGKFPVVFDFQSHKISIYTGKNENDCVKISAEKLSRECTDPRCIALLLENPNEYLLKIQHLTEIANHIAHLLNEERMSMLANS